MRIPSPFRLKEIRDSKSIMSQCAVPSWNLDHHQHHQGQEQFKGKESSSPDNIYHQQSFSQLAAMPNYEVAELTWENGQLTMHEFPTKPATWGRTGDTLESIFHQAAICNNNIQNSSLLMQQQVATTNIQETVASVVASCGEKWTDHNATRAHHQPIGQAVLAKKRERPDNYDIYGRKITGYSLHEHKVEDECAERSACGSANATFCNDINEPTMMTWASYESPRSTKTKTTDIEDSAFQGRSENQEDRETRGETGRSSSGRRGRAAAVHNQSERRRRDRINQKMKTLQKLVPNASKTDKASMLDEVIDYVKQLQAQVQMMNRYMPHMMISLGMQQQLQMSMLARMGMGAAGMGMGMGMLDLNSIACSGVPQQMTTLVQPNSSVGTSTSPFSSPHLVVPPVIPNPSAPSTTGQKPNNDKSNIVPVPLQDLYNRMAALQRQQMSQNTQAVASSIPQLNPTQRG